jgi:peptidyl-prolyl cis-trans isomerase D
MLNTFREGHGAKAIKYIALSFVMLASLGMVFMDVNGVFRNGFTDTTLAKIGKVKIDQQTFERQATPSLQAQNMNMQEAYKFGLLRNLLDEMVTREALRQEAVSEGLMLSRADLATRVHDMIKLQIQPGEKPQDTLNRLLRTQNMNEAQLMQSMRQDITSGIINASLKGAVNYTPQLAQDAMGRYNGERRDIMFFTLTPELAVAKANAEADEDTLKAYYETLKDQYQIPEERTFKAIVFSTDDVKSSATISAADVKTAYEERKEQFRIGERRKIEQIVLTDEAKAKAASESARKGTSLKSIAPQAYRAATDVEQNGLPPELSGPIFSAKSGTVLNPIKTPLGWHVIRVASVMPARLQSLADVQSDLRKELESDAMHSEMQARITKVDEALGSGQTLDQIAADMGVQIRTIGPIDAQGNFQAADADPLLTALSQNKDVLSSLFELMEGETGDLGQINDTTYAAFSIDSVRPTRDRDFAEIRDDIAKKYYEEQSRTAMNTAVDALTTQLSKGEKDFAQAAKESGAVLKTARDVSRQSKVAGLNDPIALTRLFDETDLNAVVKVPTEGGVILAQVLDARIPESGTAKLDASERAQIEQQMQQAVAALYYADLRERHDVLIKRDRLEKMYGPESQNVQP